MLTGIPTSWFHREGAEGSSQQHAGAGFTPSRQQVEQVWPMS